MAFQEGAWLISNGACQGRGLSGGGRGLLGVWPPGGVAFQKRGEGFLEGAWLMSNGVCQGCGLRGAWPIGGVASRGRGLWAGGVAYE